jgi:hypothetical protein
MNKELEILIIRLKSLFPSAPLKGLTAVAKILEQCCCPFDPCNVVGGTGAVTSLTTNNSTGVASLIAGVLNIPNYTPNITSVTFTGTSGPATLIGGVLNIPNYTPAVTPSAYRIETFVDGTILQEGVTGTTGLASNSTVITNAVFGATNPLVFRGGLILPKIDDGVNSFYTETGNDITLSSPLIAGEHLLIVYTK